MSLESPEAAIALDETRDFVLPPCTRAEALAWFFRRPSLPVKSSTGRIELTVREAPDPGAPRPRRLLELRLAAGGRAARSNLVWHRGEIDGFAAGDALREYFWRFPGLDGRVVARPGGPV